MRTNTPRCVVVSRRSPADRQAAAAGPVRQPVTQGLQKVWGQLVDHMGQIFRRIVRQIPPSW